MTELFKNNLSSSLVSTKKASSISGYNPDYLARLCRSGKINGTQVGRAWLVDRDSLEKFVESQQKRRSELATQTAVIRSEEYVRAQQKSQNAYTPMVKLVRAVAPASLSAVSPNARTRSLRMLRVPAQAVAAGVALVVITASAYASVSPTVQHTLAQLPDAVTHAARVVGRTAVLPSSFRVSEDVFASNAYAPKLTLPHATELSHDIAYATGVRPDAHREMFAEAMLASRAYDISDVAQARMRGVRQVVMHPETAAAALARAYVRTGERVLTVGSDIGTVYLARVGASADGSLALSASARDFVTSMPRRTDAMLDLYERATYAWVDASPVVATAATNAVYDVGETIGAAAARTPLALREAKEALSERWIQHSFALADSATRAQLGTGERLLAISAEGGDRYLALIGRSGNAGADAYLAAEADIEAAADRAGDTAAFARAQLSEAAQSRQAASALSFAPAAWERSFAHVLVGGSRVAHSLMEAGTRAILGMLPVPGGMSGQLAIIPFDANDTITLPSFAALPPDDIRIQGPERASTTVTQTIVQNFFPQTLLGSPTDEAVLAIVRPYVTKSIESALRSRRTSSSTSGGGTSGGVSSDGATLTNVDIQSGTASLSSLDVSGATDLNTLTVNSVDNSGTLTTGTTTVNGSLTVSGALSVGTLSFSGPVIAPYFTATSTTATSTFPNFTATNGDIDSLSADDFTATDAVIANATTTTFFSSLVRATTGILDSLVATSAIFTNSTTTNATTTNFFATRATITDAVLGSFVATLANITTAVIADLTGTNSQFTNSTTTNATSTNLFATNIAGTNASVTNLTAAAATTTSLYATTLGVGSDYLTDLTGFGLTNTGGALSVSTTSFSGSGSGLNADLLDGQDGTYYLARANHTGTQLASTISDFASTARSLFSSTAPGLTYTSGTGVFSLTSGYEIPLTASTSNWNSFYDTPSTRITAGSGLTWVGNTLNVSTSSLALDTTYFKQGGNAFGTTAVFGTTDANPLSIITGGATAATFLTNGFLGLGTTTPPERLTVAGNAAITGAVTAASLTTTGAADVDSLTIGSLSGFLKATAGAVSTALIDLSTDVTSTLPSSNGGTGFDTYASGDILYADSGGVLARLPVGSPGQVLKVQAGLPSWGVDQTAGGGGGSDGIFATSTGIIYPLDTSNVVLVGTNATSTVNSIFEVNGQAYISTRLGIATTSPSQALSVGGNALVSGTGTFGQLIDNGLTANTLTYANGSKQLSSATIGSGLSFSAGTLSVSTSSFSGSGSGFNADLLDGQDGSYYLARANHTGTQLSTTISDFNTASRALFSSTAPGLTYATSTGVFSLTSGYEIPLTASTSNWNSFFDTPSTRITAGTGLSWAGNTLNVSTSSLALDTTYFKQNGNSFGTAAILGTNDSNILQFETDNTTRLTIDTSGNVGIGTTTPGYTLVAAGDVNATGRYRVNGTQVIYVPNQTSFLGSLFYGDGGGSLTHTTAAEGFYNTAVGLSALLNNTTGNTNTAIGWAALGLNTSGSSNTATGYLALASNTTGLNNSANSYGALFSNTTGASNVGVGMNALFSNTSGSSNTAVGTRALFNNTAATSTTAIGFFAGQGTGAHANEGGTYVGYQAGVALGNAANYNTLIGYSAGSGITTGSRNVFLGPSTISASQNQVTTGSNNISIGNDVAVASSTASNQLNIGNLIYGTGLSGTGSTISTSGNIGIGTTTPSAKLTVKGAGTTTGVNFQTTNSSNTALFTILDNGNVGIATTTPGRTLTVAGDLGLTGALYAGNTSAGTSGQLLQSTGTGIQWTSTSTLGFQGSGNYITDLTGDGTATGPGSAVLTLATVNGNVGSFGSSTAIPTFTVNGKGLITAASTTAVVAPAGTLTGTTLASNVVNSSLTSLGTLTSLAVSGGTTLANATSTSLYTTTLGINSESFTDLTGTGLSNVGGVLTVSTSSLALDTTYFKQNGNSFGATAVLGTNDTNALVFETNNTEALRINTDRQLISNIGSAANVPSFTWTGDLTTGLFHPASNAIGFSTGGIERMRLDGNGYLGIGTTTPAAKLTIMGDGFAGGINFQTTNASSTPLFTILDNGNIGIGSSTPGSKLAVTGGNITQTISTDPTLVTYITDTQLDGVAEVQVVGNYAYTVGSTTFAVIDISKPTDPVIVGSINDATNIRTNDVASLRIAGHYAYIGSQSRFTIIDIADPSNPRVVSSLTSALFSPLDPLSVYISGKYAYVASGRSAHTFLSIDISDPLVPFIADTEDFGALGASTAGIDSFVNEIYVQGRYAYIAIGSGASEKIQIYDVSDPLNVRLISQASLPTGGDIVTDIVADNRYVYVGGDFNTLWTVDVSDPLNPVVETYGGNCGRSLYKSGDYLYGVAYFGTPGICVYDVSDPTVAPVQVGFTQGPFGTTVATHGLTGLTVSGHYAYTVSHFQDSFLVYDVTGTILPTANIGNLNIGNGFVTGNFDIYNSANIQGGLNVGVGGFYTEGAIASAATTSPSYFGASLGIGTTSPIARLSVKGFGTTTGINFTTTNSANTRLFTILDSGNVGIGTTSPAALLSVAGNSLITGTGTFGQIIDSGLTADTLTYANGSKQLSSVTIGSGLSFTGGTLSVSTSSLALDTTYFKQGGNSFGAAAILGTNDSNILQFETNNTTRLTIDTSGNVGIGSTSPAAKLTVKGAGTTTGVNFQTTNSSDTPLFTILDSGNVGIGTTTPGYTLVAAGDVNATGRYRVNGTQVLYFPNQTSFLGSVFYGDGGGSLTHTTAVEGFYNTAVGMSALLSNTTGHTNTAVGWASLGLNTSGTSNTATGYLALASNLTGLNNSGFAYGALYGNTTGTSNVGVGMNAMFSNTSGSSNTAVGTRALFNNTAATSTTAVGFQVGQGTGAHANEGGTYVGYQAGTALGNAANYNTLIGYSAGSGVTTGSRNVFLGAATISASQGQVTTGSGNISIGNDVAVASSTASNQLNIGNLIYGTGLDGTGATLSTGFIGIGTTSPASRLSVTGTSGSAAPIFSVASSTNTSFFGVNATGAITFNGQAGTSGQVLQSFGSAASPQWVATSTLGYQASGNYITALTGDVTASGPGSAVATLATVNSNTGSFGSSTAIPTITVNGKGLITAVTTNAVVAPAGTLTGTTLASNVVTSSLTSVGTLTGLTVSGNTTLAAATSTSFYTTTLGINSESFTDLTGTGLTNVGGALTVSTSSLALDATYFAQGGNAFGTTATLGTNDSNALVFETNNIERLRINTSGQLVSAIAAAANTPAFTWTGDLTTGIYHPATNAIGFSTGGIERMRLDGNGYLGIGTTTAGRTLTVAGDLGVTGAFYAGDTSAGVAGQILQTTGTGTQWVSTSSLGIVGSGTVTSVNASGGTTGLTFSGGPVTTTGTLTLAGTLAVANGGTGTSTQTTNGVNYYNGSIITSGTGLTFDGTNLGVGSTTPSAKLTVKGTGTTTGVNFQTTDSANTPLFTILDSGNVGIGSTSPAGKLGILGGTSGTILAIDTGSGYTGSIIDAKRNGTSAFTVAHTGAITLRSTTAVTVPITWVGSDARTGTLTGNGANVSLGGGYISALDSNTAVPRFSATNSNGVTIFFNLFDENAAGVMAQRNSTNAQKYRIYNTYTSQTNYERGALNWDSNVFRIGTENQTGTARDLAFMTASTTRMTITAAGDVGIGTSTPTAQFHITSTFRNSSFSTGSLQSDASGNITASSDERLKDIDSTFDRGLADLTKLSPILYHWNEVSGLDRTTQYAGFSAQNVQAAIPEATGVDPRGYLTLNDRPILAASVNAIKELAGRTASFATTSSNLALRMQSIEDLARRAEEAADLPHELVATRVTAESMEIAHGVSVGTLHTQSMHADGSVSAARYIVPASAEVFTFGSTTVEILLPDEVLTDSATSVDLYKLASYGVASVQSLASRVDLLDVRLDDIESRLAWLETSQEHASSTENAPGPISLAGASLQHLLESFGIMVRDGLAQFTTLVAHQLVLSEDENGTASAGSVVVPIGETEFTVENTLVLPTSKIFLTFTSSVDGSWHLSKKEEGSFTVTFAKAQPSEVSFDYFFVQTEGQIASVGASAAPVQPPLPAPSGGTPPPAPVDGDPSIILNGEASMQIPQGASWTDPGARATASDGTDLTGSIATSGGVDADTPGQYTVTYRVTDSAGRFAEASRTVRVLAPSVGGGSDTPTEPPASAPEPEPEPEPAPEPPADPAPAA